MIKAIVKLDSKLFNDAERRQAKSSFVRRQGKDFKDLTKRRMIEGPQSGRLYARKRGEGFGRSHRASRRGQRPAPDTLTLVNAITDRRLSEDSAEVFVAPKANPVNGVSADRYAEILQLSLGRPIMTKLDAEEAERKAAHDGEQMLSTLV